MEPAIHSNTLGQTRNIGIMAHIDAGKTTTTERILFYAGVTQRMGAVDDGTAFTDWMEQEQERGISITAACTTFHWRDHVVNLIDTPGHVDFTIEVERSLRVLDGAVVVFCAVRGVEAQSETVWRQADRYHVPRVAFINKCDRVGADPQAVIQAMRQRLGTNPILVQLPHTLEDDFDGIIDLVSMRSRTWDARSLGSIFADGPIPGALIDAATRARETMLEALADVDDAFMQRFLEAENVADEEVASALRRATLAGRAVPVLIGAAIKNKGIHGLLDAIIGYLPSPADVPPVRGIRARGGAGAGAGAGPDDGAPSPIEVRADGAAPSCALAFKVMVDPQVGRLTYFRVYAGQVSSGDSLLNVNKGARERLDRIVRMRANEREDVDAVAVGQIGAALGLRTTTTGDTLCDPSAPILLDSIQCPEPVIRMVLVPATDDDAARLPEALQRLAVEDPSFHVGEDPETSETVLSGMGELHLEIVTDRLRRESGLRFGTGRPQVAYRETVTRGARAERRYVRQTSCPGHYGHVVLEVAPRERGQGLRFENRAPAHEIPRDFAAAVEHGVREVVQRGFVAGFPMTDLEVVLLGGTSHPVDSSILSFKIAGSQAFIQALQDAGATLLEPLMAVEVVTPEAFVGEVIGDLSSRRGKITGIQARSGVQVIAGLVPLATMFGYATELRSRTQGRATYTMQFESYAEVPSGIREDLIARVRGTRAESRNM